MKFLVAMADNDPLPLLAARTARGVVRRHAKAEANTVLRGAGIVIVQEVVVDKQAALVKTSKNRETKQYHRADVTSNSAGQPETVSLR